MSDYNGGWIPYPERTHEQQVAHDQWMEDTGFFGDILTEVDLPDESIGFHLFEQLGMAQPRVWQQTGSCVGAGDAVADAIARAGDVVFRGDQERVELPYPYATWGMGRAMANMGGPGEGSYGSIQARAANEWGYLPMDHPSLPRPTVIESVWYTWTVGQERQWSWPSNWPVTESSLRPVANKYRSGRKYQARTQLEVDQALAQGYGVTVASNYGASNEGMKIIDGLLVARWDKSWAHQMCVSKYKITASGKYYLILNQWGRKAHPACPYASRWGVTGCFWQPEQDFVKNLTMRYTEVMVHTSTGGFEPRVIPWATVV